MNPKFLVLLLHIGGIIKTIKDVEKGIADAVHGEFSEADAKLILDDVLGLLSSGVINIPGVTQDQINQVAQNVQNQVKTAQA